MPALSALLYVLDSAGNRVDPTQPDGSRLPVAIKLGPNLGASATTNGGVVEVTIAATTPGSSDTSTVREASYTYAVDASLPSRIGPIPPSPSNLWDAEELAAMILVMSTGLEVAVPVNKTHGSLDTFPLPVGIPQHGTVSEAGLVDVAMGAFATGYVGYAVSATKIVMYLPSAVIHKSVAGAYGACVASYGGRGFATDPANNKVWTCSATDADNFTPTVAWSASGTSPWGIAIDHDRGIAYVACRTTNEVRAFSIDPTTGVFTQTNSYAVTGPLHRIILAGGYVWAPATATGTLSRINVTTGAVDTVTLGGSFTVQSTLAIDRGPMRPGTLWVGCGTNLVNLDPVTLAFRVLSTSGHEIRGISVAANGDVYFVDWNSGTGASSVDRVAYGPPPFGQDVSACFHRSGVQLIGASSWTPVQFDVVDYDTSNFQTSSSTFTIPSAGKYMVGFGHDWGAGAGTIRDAQVTVGGGVGVGTLLMRDQRGARTGVSCSRETPFAGGEVLELSVYQDTAGNLDLTGPYLTIRRVG